MPEQASNGKAGRLVLISGTGTGIGKTHVSEAILGALGTRGLTTAGLKPIETGVNGASESDAERLGKASTFHVKHMPYAFNAPLAPHLAAREAHAAPIRPDVVVHFVRAARSCVDIALVELPGGLFSPLTDDLVNADLARGLAADVLFLVAPDRLGVLHDVLAVTRAARMVPIRPDAIILIAPASSDASTGRNAPELRRLLDVPLIFAIGRKAVQDLAVDPIIQEIATRCTE